MQIQACTCGVCSDRVCGTFLPVLSILSVPCTCVYLTPAFCCPCKAFWAREEWRPGKSESGACGARPTLSSVVPLIIYSFLPLTTTITAVLVVLPDVLTFAVAGRPRSPSSPILDTHFLHSITCRFCGATACGNRLTLRILGRPPRPQCRQATSKTALPRCSSATCHPRTMPPKQRTRLRRRAAGA